MTIVFKKLRIDEQESIKAGLALDHKDLGDPDNCGKPTTNTNACILAGEHSATLQTMTYECK